MVCGLEAGPQGTHNPPLSPPPPCNPSHHIPPLAALLDSNAQQASKPMSGLSPSQLHHHGLVLQAGSPRVDTAQTDAQPAAHPLLDTSFACLWVSATCWCCCSMSLSSSLRDSCTSRLSPELLAVEPPGKASTPWGPFLLCLCLCAGPTWHMVYVNAGLTQHLECGCAQLSQHLACVCVYLQGTASASVCA